MVRDLELPTQRLTIRNELSEKKSGILIDHRWIKIKNPFGIQVNTSSSLGDYILASG
jgi:hypothetical protein